MNKNNAPPPLHDVKSFRFVFDLACPYSYLAFREVEAVARRTGTTMRVDYVPLLLGLIRGRVPRRCRLPSVPSHDATSRGRGVTGPRSTTVRTLPALAAAVPQRVGGRRGRRGRGGARRDPAGLL